MGIIKTDPVGTLRYFQAIRRNNMAKGGGVETELEGEKIIFKDEELLFSSSPETCQQ